MISTKKRAPINPKLIVILGVLSVSLSFAFIRWSDAPPVITAMYRLLFSLPFFMVSSLRNHRSEFKQLTKQKITICLITGILLALHFICWMTALNYTSVASAVVLVCCHPIIIMIASTLIFKERYPKASVFGVLIAFLGCIIISSGDLSFSKTMILGDLLAFLGAVFIAIYFLIGKKMRTDISASVYTLIVYSGCFTTLFVIALIFKLPFYPYSKTSFISIFALALICTVIGHGIFNWALEFVTPTFLSTAILSESAISILLAIPLLGELPTSWQIVGSVVTIVGIYIYNQYEILRHDFNK